MLMLRSTCWYVTSLAALGTIDRRTLIQALMYNNHLLFFTLCLVRRSILICYQAIFGISDRFRYVSTTLGVLSIPLALGAMLGNIF
jgi:hypothetical protein